MIFKTASGQLDKLQSSNSSPAPDQRMVNLGHLGHVRFTMDQLQHLGHHLGQLMVDPTMIHDSHAEVSALGIATAPGWSNHWRCHLDALPW